MDRHVQRRQPLGDHPFEVGLGESGEGGEVPEQEAEPVVVVLEVQAAAHAWRQLVDEAELAVVVAGADPVEHGGVDVDAERLTSPLGDVELELQPAAAQLQPRVGLIGQHAVLDDVAYDLPAQRDQLIARLDAGAGGGRARGDGHDAGRLTRAARLEGRT